jgi:hypothetical protein
MTQVRKTNRRKPVKPKTQKAGLKEKSHAEVVAFFMEMLTTIKLYHWKTRSYAQHKATDDLHERLQSNIDKFVEVMLGKASGKSRGGADRIKMIQKCLHIFDFSKKSAFRDQLIEYREFLLRMSQFLDRDRDTDLLNIRDEMVADVNQFLYLLTFDK